jgi:serine/threonine protein kinase/outer membrane protein assembly factor BamB
MRGRGWSESWGAGDDTAEASDRSAGAAKCKIGQCAWTAWRNLCAITVLRVAGCGTLRGVPLGEDLLKRGARFGPYEIVDPLGFGGFGVVYSARHVKLRRLTALKILHRSIAVDPTNVERLMREGEAIASLKHPNIVGIYDVGEHHGRSYLAMEYIAGRSLAQILQDGSPLTAARTARILAQVATALDHIHRNGIVHRDVKGSNVLVRDEGTPDETAYVVDFGISRLGRPDLADLTGGHAIGTPTYMSPEQLDYTSAVGAKSDQYSLACVAFECLTGSPPFQGTTSRILSAHIRSLPPRASSFRSGLTPTIDDVMLRALAKEPDDRFESCLAFVNALRKAFDVSIDGVARPPSVSDGGISQDNFPWPGTTLPEPILGGPPVDPHAPTKPEHPTIPRPKPRSSKTRIEHNSRARSAIRRRTLVGGLASIAVLSIAGIGWRALRAPRAELIWKAGPGKGYGCRIAVAANRVFAGSKDGNLYAFDAASGKELWRYATGGEIDVEPAVEGDRVFVGGWGMAISAVNAGTGARLWVRTLGETTNRPVVRDGVVYVGTSQALYALDARSGRTKWQYPCAPNGMAVDGSSLYTGVMIVPPPNDYVRDGEILAFDRWTGRIKWRQRTLFSPTAPTPAGTRVYVNKASVGVLTLEAATGKPVWDETIVDIAGSPVSSGDTLFLNGFPPIAIDAHSGAIRWKADNVSGNLSSAILADDVLYVAGEQGSSACAIDSKDGSLLWHYGTDQPVRSEPAYMAGTLYIASDEGHLYAVREPQPA